MRSRSQIVLDLHLLRPCQEAKNKLLHRYSDVFVLIADNRGFLLVYQKRDNHISNEQAVLVPVGTQYVREKRDLSFLFATKLGIIRAFFFVVDEVYIKSEYLPMVSPLDSCFVDSRPVCFRGFLLVGNVYTKKKWR
jgi:hypothetical protein